jgi:hypothetical protein
MTSRLFIESGRTSLLQAHSDLLRYYLPSGQLSQTLSGKDQPFHERGNMTVVRQNSPFP